MSPVRVLHVIGGSEFGGIVAYVASLVKMAQDHGAEVRVLATNTRIVSYFRDRRIEVVPLEGIDRAVNPVRDLEGLLRLVRHLRQADYSIVHTHTSKGGVIGRFAARLARVPVVIHTTQGYAFNDYATNPISRWVYRELERYATRCGDVVIAANEVDRELAIESGIVSAANVVAISNGIDLPAIDRASSPPGLREQLGLDPGRVTVGAMARLSQQKGIEYLLRAAPEVLRVHPEAQFLVVGDGPLRPQLEALAAHLGLRSAVRFVGFRSDWVEVLRVMDVFVMPSLWEGLPITLLGAMAATRPIVATRIKGITDVCGDGDVMRLVEPRNGSALAHSILALLNDRSLARWYGEAARRKVEEEYSEAVMNRRTWEVYARLLVQKQPSASGGVIE